MLQARINQKDSYPSLGQDSFGSTKQIYSTFSNNNTSSQVQTPYNRGLESFV